MILIYRNAKISILDEKTIRIVNFRNSCKIPIFPFRGIPRIRIHQEYRGKFLFFRFNNTLNFIKPGAWRYATQKTVVLDLGIHLVIP